MMPPLLSQLGQIFAAFINRMVEFFRAILESAATLKVMENAGELSENWQDFLAEAVGIKEEQVVDQKTREVVREIDPELVPFSVREDENPLSEDKRDVKFLSDEQKQRFQEKLPEARLLFERLGAFGEIPSEQLAQVFRNYRQSAIGETLLVDQALKPLFHEEGIFSEDKAQEFVALVKKTFPHLEAEAWGLHVVVWHPTLVQDIINSDPEYYGVDVREAIKRTAESGEIGELLGNFARTIQDGDAVVHYFVDGQEIAGGFVTHSDTLSEISEQRRQALEMAFERPVEMRVDLKQDTQSSEGSQTQFSIREDLSKVTEEQETQAMQDALKVFEKLLPKSQENIRRVARKQKQDIREQYEGTPMWRKAPNGKESNLTEDQWLTVRTPLFKQWFGDWEALSRINQVRSLQAFDATNTKPVADQAEAKRVFQEFGDKVTNNIDGRQVRFPASMAGKILRHQGFDSSAIVGVMDKLFEQSVPAWSENEILRDGHKPHKNVEKYHHYIGRIRHGINDFFIRFTVTEMVAKKKNVAENLAHSSFISDVSLYEKSVGSSLPVIDRAKVPPTPYDEKLAQWLSSVNPESVSKVIDENGEPMPVYHGTPDKRFIDKTGVFASIDSRFGKAEEGAGTHWFSDRRGVASTYADDTRALDYQNAEAGIIDTFINIRNPLIIDGNFKDWATVQEAGKTSDVIEKAQKEGNDGIIIRNVRDEYLSHNGRGAVSNTFATFSSKQIKHATDNIGAFSQSQRIDFSIRSGDLSEAISDQVDRRKAPPSERVEHKEK